MNQLHLTNLPHTKEDLYFYQKDQELIKKIKKELILEQKKLLKNHCSFCAEETKEIVFKEIEGLYCSNCDNISLSLDKLKNLLK